MRTSPIRYDRRICSNCNILDDPEASDNDRFVALDLLERQHRRRRRAADVPDTGTAIVKAKKGQFVLTSGGDEAAIARSAYNTYLTSNRVQPDGAADHVRREEHRQQPSGGDQDRRRRR